MLKAVLISFTVYGVMFVFVGTHHVLINLLISIIYGVSVMSKDDRLTSDMEAILAAFTAGT
jgi:hypothetical protein